MDVHQREMKTYFYEVFDNLHEALKLKQSKGGKRVVVVVDQGEIFRIDEEYSTFRRNCLKKVQEAHYRPKLKTE
jgi:hypothetical protein